MAYVYHTVHETVNVFRILNVISNTFYSFFGFHLLLFLLYLNRIPVGSRHSVPLVYVDMTMEPMKKMHFPWNNGFSFPFYLQLNLSTFRLFRFFVVFCFVLFDVNSSFELYSFRSFGQATM